VVSRGRHGFGAAVVHQGKELSFTNLLDLDAAARIALEFDEPAAVVIKHTNPCGAATGGSLADAYVRAREADPLSAFGGIVGLNRPIDLETARALTSTFIEAVVAPGIGPDGRDGPDGSDGNDGAIRAVLASKPNLRVVTASFGELINVRDARTILGAWLVQAQDRVTEGRGRVARRRGPAGRDAARADTGRVGGIAVRLARRGARQVEYGDLHGHGRNPRRGRGADEPGRRRARSRDEGWRSAAGSVVASDAFFPFRDGVDAIAQAGATAIVQPGGSMRDAEVIAAADEHGLAMVTTGRRHFRH
jgi:phosphoribosylaminoimidazolecarboxamide formyltransferase/IMP cyclohydrolase